MLVAGGLFEMCFTFCIGKARYAEGLEFWAWIAGFLVSTSLSMYLLAKASYAIPIGTAYPVWAGIGAVGTAVVGVLFFGEPATFWRLFFIATLIGSIIGLKML